MSKGNINNLKIIMSMRFSLSCDHLKFCIDKAHVNMLIRKMADFGIFCLKIV